VVKQDGRNKTLTGKQLLDFVRIACKSTVAIISDEFSGYNVLNYRKTEFFHLTIDHSFGQYSDHKGTYINGMCHHVSVKCPQYYINDIIEFCFRLNNMESKNVFNNLLGQAIMSVH
jgi:hypothetical protein